MRFRMCAKMDSVAKWNRKRIAGWVAATVMSVWIPVAIDQAYFRYNAYILPVVGLIAALAYAGLILTSPAISSRIESFHHGFGVANPLKYILAASSAGALFILLLGGGEWYAIKKSQEHVTALKTNDSSKPSTPVPITQHTPTTASNALPQPRGNVNNKTVPAPSANPSPIPALPRSPLTQPNSTDSASSGQQKKPAGGVVNNAPGGIANSGSIGQATVVNNGPPPAIVTWHTEPNKQGSKYIDIKLSVDRTPTIPAFIAECDVPCHGVGAWVLSATAGYIVDVESHGYLVPGQPSKAVMLMTSPKPIGFGSDILWSIESVTGAPIIIKSVGLLPENQAKLLPLAPP
jgi:hypothetical protein